MRRLPAITQALTSRCSLEAAWSRAAMFRNDVMLLPSALERSESGGMDQSTQALGEPLASTPTQERSGIQLNDSNTLGFSPSKAT